MQTGNLSKPFGVDVYSDYIATKQCSWVRIGEFDDLDDAVETCKMVVDDFLCLHVNVFNSPDRLINEFLSYGDVPAIIGTENLKSFDIYEYLTQRCNEIFSAKESNPILF